MKLEKIVNLNFQKSLNKLTAMNLPIRTSYKLRQIAGRVREETKTFEDMRAEKARFYADKDGSGQPIMEEKRDERGMLYTQFSITEENKAKFNHDMRELLDLEVDLPYILLDELGEQQFTAEDLLLLEFIVDAIPAPKPAPAPAPQAPLEPEAKGAKKKKK